MTAGKRNRTFSWVFLLIILALIAGGNGEIHRAKSTKTITAGQLPRFPPSGFSDHDEEVKLPDSDQDAPKGHSQETWTYAMLSATAVGLSGIFPLLVIPLETGKNLRQGAAAARLKLFLSFAVGGLLGDVFLHLLPEAWAHVKGSEDHRGHLEIGMWVMVGLFCFLIVEKIFPDDEDEEEEEEEEENQKTRELGKTEIATGVGGPVTRSQVKHRKTPLATNGHSNTHITSNGHLNGHVNGYMNGHVNGIQNGMRNDKGDLGSKVKDRAEEESHIKTSGWLNLMANVVDNFTHGLAVAGSYCISTKSGLITTAAVLLHEIPHEIGDFAILLQSGFDRWKAAKAQLLTASGGLLGAVAALASESAEVAGDRTAWILPFTSGGFIYIALVTVVPNLLKEKCPWESMKQIACILTGITLVAGVSLLCE